MLDVTQLTKLCGVSRSGYYNWRKTTQPNQALAEQQDQAAFEWILKAYQYRGYQKGYRTIHMLLLQWEVHMNTKKVRRLMRKYNLRCSVRRRNPYKVARAKFSRAHVSPNHVQRQFKAFGPRIILLTDITYIPYGRGRMAYMNTVKDAYTNEILAYTVSTQLVMDFVIECMNDLAATHGISLSQHTIIHSDQGSHYTSIQFQALLKHHRLIQSMSRKGNCWDNAPQESFFGHMKDHLKLEDIDDIEDVKTAIVDFVDYYNNDRPQWKLAKLTPSQYYQFHQTGVYPLDHLIKTPELPAVRTMELSI